MIWNNNINGWIIHDIYNQKIFFWESSQKEVTELNPPIKNIELNYFFNNDGNFVIATEENDFGIILRWWIGSISNGKISWQVPESIVKGLNNKIIVSPDGTKASAIRSINTKKTLCVLEIKSGKIVEEAPIEENYSNVELGWFSNTEVISAGNKGLFRLSLKKPSIPFSNLKVK